MEGSSHSQTALSALGASTPFPKAYNAALLEAIPNAWNHRDYTVRLECLEFTALCPVTGQPDFATLSIEYIPDQKLVESKSLKLYLGGFRNEAHFHEAVVNVICDDLVALLNPKKLSIRGNFNARGGIAILPEVTWKREGKQ